MIILHVKYVGLVASNVCQGHLTRQQVSQAILLVHNINIFIISFMSASCLLNFIGCHFKKDQNGIHVSEQRRMVTFQCCDKFIPQIQMSWPLCKFRTSKPNLVQPTKLLWSVT